MILFFQKFKKGRKDTATIDAAIGSLRQALTKRSARSGNTWVSELASATRGINARSRDALHDSSAKDVKGDIPLRIDLRVESTEKSLENETRMEKRDAKLQELGAFRWRTRRALPAGGNPGGPRRSTESQRSCTGPS